ncbi:MAG: hypothetical protein ACP5J5_02775 [Dissulfurimicrobium sp.]|uniref:hypothetical protein n=1 Tax=Dissulfurimicrobium TaxID=1769732 RepID=UPI001EDC81C6|nr:hypothetical protein [Dissulfurimicrobium hydrothermale]UKL13455.1 hypothetical protein LGS26_08240 [Dissulfurimicrobium hydrothermale]
MILFTSRRCGRCREIEDVFNLGAIGIENVVLTDDNAEGLAELAWLGLIEKARASLPILVDDNGLVCLDLGDIINNISRRARDVLTARLLSGQGGGDAAGSGNTRGGFCEDGLCIFP